MVGRHAGAWYASHLLLWAGVVLMLPAILRLASLVHRRAPRLALAGGGLAGLGAVCFAGLLTMGFVVWQMAAPGADRAQMAALFKRLFHAPGFLIPFEILPLGFAVGMALIAVGLRRSGRASHSSAVMIALGALGISLIGIVPSSIYALTASGALAAGLAPLGCTLLAERRAAPGARVARRSIQAQAR